MKTTIAMSLGLVLGLAGCGPAASTPDVPEDSANPSPKPNDFALGADFVYVKNDAVKLPREYWITIRGEDGAFALLPRPDGALPIAAECKTDSADAKRFREADLCESATSEAAVKKINSLSREDAMSVSSWLHERLEFRVDGDRIEPYPLVSDILEVCEQFPAERAGALKRICDFEMAAAARGTRPSIGMVWSEQELAVLPGALNRLYGVEPSAAR